MECERNPFYMQDEILSQLKMNSIALSPLAMTSFTSHPLTKALNSNINL